MFIKYWKSIIANYSKFYLGWIFFLDLASSHSDLLQSHMIPGRVAFWSQAVRDSLVAVGALRCDYRVKACVRFNFRSLYYIL